ncbi:MAG: response regulator transcription factor [Patescibacteria group bacterium]|jgi:DNA-binding response OmpR family regulator
MNLLLIEDDPDLVSTLSLALAKNNFKIETATNGERGYELATSKNYDLIILDCNLPKLSGSEIIKKLRADGRAIPILVLTVLAEINNKVELFELGADDYLTKPFAISELLVRIKALLRRSPVLKGNILKIGEIELDPDKFLVTKNNKRLALSSKEFSLLEYFLNNSGRVLSRQEIMDNVWDENHDPFSNTIEVHIMNLRKKLGGADEQIISTVPGRGYKIDR